MIQRVKQVELSQSSLSIPDGGTATLTASVLPANATNPALEWTVSDPNIVYCEDGLLTAMNPGTTLVTVRSMDDPSIYAACEVTVRIPVETVSLNRTEITLTPGQSFRLTPDFLPTNASARYIDRWLSVDSFVATVKDGLVTAVKAGTTYVTAYTIDKVYATCKVNVVVPASGISLDRTEYILNSSTGGQLNASIYPANTTETIRWTSSDPDIVCVYSDGSFLARRIGTATITASSSSGSYSASCKVTVVSFAHADISFDDDLVLPGNSTTCRLELHGGYAPYNVTLQLERVSDGSEVFSQSWSNVYGLSLSAVLPILETGEYRATAAIKDVTGFKTSSTKSLTVGKRVSIAKVSLPSNAYLNTNYAYKFTAIPQDGVAPYTVRMELCREANPHSPMQDRTFRNCTSGQEIVYEPYFGYSGSFFVRATVTDAIGDTFSMDSDVFTVLDIPVRYITPSASQITVNKGDVFDIRVSVSPSDATDKRVLMNLSSSRVLNWQTCFESDVYRFEAQRGGSCTLTFSSYDRSVCAVVNVTVVEEPKPVTVIVIGPPESTEEEKATIEQVRQEEERRREDREQNDQEEQTTTEVIITGGETKHFDSGNTVYTYDEFPNIIQPQLSVVKLGTKILCYPIGSSSIIPYADKGLNQRGDINGPRDNATIYATDRLEILDIGLTGGIYWAKVTYPAGSTRKTAYIDMWDVIYGTQSETKNASVAFCLSSKCGGAKDGGYVEKGLPMYLLYKDGSNCQIMIPQTDGTYIIGWCTRDEYDGKIKAFDPVWPCANTYRITTLYRYSHHADSKIAGKVHSCRFKNGIDISGDYGEKVLAVESGTVIYASDTNSAARGFGNYIKIRHDNGMVSLYAHLSKVYVTEGQRVYPGMEIGAVGNSGGVETHLHFELAIDDKGGAEGDPWATYYRDKYRSKIHYAPSTYASYSANPKAVIDWIKANGILD